MHLQILFERIILIAGKIATVRSWLHQIELWCNLRGEKGFFITGNCCWYIYSIAVFKIYHIKYDLWFFVMPICSTFALSDVSFFWQHGTQNKSTYHIIVSQWFHPESCACLLTSWLNQRGKNLGSFGTWKCQVQAGARVLGVNGPLLLQKGKRLYF